MNAVETRLFTPQDRDWLIERHATLYAQDEDFDESFGPFVAGIVDSFLLHHDPDREAGWIVEHVETKQRLGCIFCARDTDQIARLRMFLLVPEARGRGLGRHLLETCMEFAQSRGYGEIVLSTHESHAAACALYRRYGWRLEASKPVRSFGRDLIEQQWNYQF